MKALKLILVFVAILGGLVGAWYISTLFGGGGEGIDPHSDTTYETYRNQFEQDWQSKGDWDEATFKAHCDIVQQLSADYSVAELEDMNTKTATKLVNEKIFKEWKNPSCSKGVVDKYWRAVQVIEGADANAKSDPNIKKIKSVYSSYTQALSLATMSIGANPGFNGHSWTSYDSYCSSIKSKKNAVLADGNYRQYLSNISVIKNGINSIDGKLASGRGAFYSKLGNQIISYFNSKPRTPDVLSQLYNVSDRYRSESGSSMLVGFVQRFDSEIEL